jgi:hypothetical protein
MPSIFGNTEKVRALVRRIRHGSSEPFGDVASDPGLGPNEPPRRTIWQRIVAAVRHGLDRWTS